MILEPPTVTAPAEHLLAALRRCHGELATRVRRPGEADLTRQSYRADWPGGPPLAPAPGAAKAEHGLARLRVRPGGC
jgi:hypothetical protein